MVYDGATGFPLTAWLRPGTVHASLGAVAILDNSVTALRAAWPRVGMRVRSDNGEGLFQCKGGKVPRGMIFVPYGPPTCRLMGQTTDGTGMPTSKGWEVEVEPAPKDDKRS